MLHQTSDSRFTACSHREHCTGNGAIMVMHEISLTGAEAKDQIISLRQEHDAERTEARAALNSFDIFDIFY